MRTSGYRPQSNGQIERFHRSLNSMLGKVIDEKQRCWDEFVPGVLAAYRATPHSSTGYTPNFLMFGRETRMECDLAYGVDEGESQAHDSYDSFTCREWSGPTPRVLSTG